MPDHGRPLRFGSFVSPTNDPPERPVELAVRSEELGLDLVTFQDHPYLDTFHDTWTLLAYVAARTERVQLAGNVLSVPLRQPAVLARAAAGLDLLTGGRLALGLGAGAFWDGIEAMGGPRLSGGQAVDALDEAIEVVRGIWDTGAPGPLRVDGHHHRVAGAKRGPATGHPIPVWVGAYRPRMLRLTGARADGWLPSLPYLKAGDLTRGNRLVDEAARAAGRDPAAVERLLNVTPEQSVEDLVGLAREEGISTFIVMGDDPGVLHRFARETAPAVRERVERSRRRDDRSTRAPAYPGSPAAAPTPTSRGTETVPAGGAPVRDVTALGLRRPGIDYDGLPDALAGRAVEPGDAGWSRYTSSYLRGGAPGLVLRPRDAAEVAQAVLVAGRHRELPLGVLSAGHGLSGRSINDGGLVVDVSAIDAVEVLDADAGLVRIGPGARWVDVARALTPHGLALTSGDYGGVGVGGLATAGGVGWFARAHGLTIDHLVAVEVVLADGTLVRADEHEHPDLFWAVRGAGANFGVVVAFEFRAQRVGQVAFAQLLFEVDDVAEFLPRWGAAVEASHRSVTGEVILGASRGAAQQVRALLVVDSADPETIVERLQPVAAAAPLLDQSVGLGTYAQVMEAMHVDGPQRGRGQPTAHSGLVEHLTPAFARVAADLLADGASTFFQVRAVGGAVADVDPAATAYGWRSANFSVSAFATPGGGLDAWWERLTEHMEGLYLSFETDLGETALTRAFPPGHLRRLRQLKRRYDPTGLFRDNFFIPPEAETEAGTGDGARPSGEPTPTDPDPADGLDATDEPAA